MRRTIPNVIEPWLLVVAWLLFVFFMSTETFSFENTLSVVKGAVGFFFPRLSPDEIDAINWVIRKGMHVFEYIVLGLLLLWAFRTGSSEGWTWRHPLLAAGGVFLMALADEFHQSFDAARTASIIDVGIDTAAGLLAQYVGFLWYRNRGRRPMGSPSGDDGPSRHIPKRRGDGPQPVSPPS